LSNLKENSILHSLRDKVKESNSTGHLQAAIRHLATQISKCKMRMIYIVEIIIIYS